MISKDDPRFVAVKAFIIFATGVIGSKLLWGVTMSEPPIASAADTLFGGALFWLIYYLTQKTDAQRFYRRSANEMADALEAAESKLDHCLRVVQEYVSSELADDPSQDDPSCELYPLIELVRNTTVK